MENLNSLREKILICDMKVIEILKKRFLYAKKIAKLKAKGNLEICQPDVEKKLRSNWLDQSDELTDEAFLNNILDLVLERSKEVQG